MRLQMRSGKALFYLLCQTHCDKVWEGMGFVCLLQFAHPMQSNMLICIFALAELLLSEPLAARILRDGAAAPRGARTCKSWKLRSASLTLDSVSYLLV